MALDFLRQLGASAGRHAPDHWLICIPPFPRKQPPLQIGPERSRVWSGGADP